MFKKVLLTAKEKKVIKKIIRVQLNNLNNILNKDCSLDLTLELLRQGFTEEQFAGWVNDNIQLFKNVQNNPAEFFNLKDGDLSIAKHIMWDFIEHPKYDEARSQVWRKLLIAEKFHENNPLQ